MKWKGINNQKELRPYLFSRTGISRFSFTRFGESLLMQFLVKGKGSPFKKEEGDYPSAESNPGQNKTESDLM